jgi:4-hydroxythreonine-4-phosphate dehydrogenase
MVKLPAPNTLPLALSQGDPAGVGPELTLKAWLDTHECPDGPAFFAVADPDHLAAVASELNMDVPVKIAEAGESAELFRHALPVCALNQSVAGKPGAPDVKDAAGTIASIETCVRLVRSGEASAAVTNPISKQLFYQANFPYPGHTEYMAELAQRYFGTRARAIMLIWSPDLAVVPATVHVPLARVPALLTRELLVETGIVTARDLALRFGIKDPRLAFTGLNPHAGEGGAMGREEFEVIAPALSDLAAAGVVASGPHAADSLFRPSARKNYDAVIAMYHDQALIPIKTIAFDHAVNVTLGLPFIRTSPDHGTAFDIAGKGIADPASLVAALRLAAKLARHAASSSRPGASRESRPNCASRR